MRVEEELTRTAPIRDTVLTIGVFDGVHLGHQHLIKEVKHQAKPHGFLSGIVTFYPHPRLVLFPKKKLTYLTSLEERLALLRHGGAEIVATLSFDSALAQLGARDFLALLQRHLRMRALVVGPDFALGHKRAGTLIRLDLLSQELGFSLRIVPPQVLDGTVISSSSIRDALARGDMLRVAQLLGRRLSLSGTVIRGVERGRVLGFPTANIVMDPNRALPTNGVYAASALVNDNQYQAVINIGRRPTFDNGERMVEVHLLNFEDDLYNKPLRIELVERIRDELRFSSVEKLKAEITRDIGKAREILKK